MADDDNKIVIPIEVTGDDEARRKFEALSETMQRVITKQSANAGISTSEFLQRGEALSNSIAQANARAGNFVQPPPIPGAPQRPARESSAPPNLERKLLAESASEVGASAEGIRLFREAIHALHPALAEAGVGLGELTAFTYAARGGVIALSVAVGTYLVTALEKAGDEVREQSTRIGAFAGGPREGHERQEELSRASDDLRVRTSTLTGPYESLLRINQSSGDQTPSSQHELIDALKNLTVATRADAGDNKTKSDALAAFAKRTQEQGFVDPADSVKEILPKTFAAILEQLKKDNPDKQTYTGQDLIRATSGSQFGERASREAAERLRINPEGISEAFDTLKTSADKLSEAAGGGHVIASALESTAKLLDLMRTGIEKLREHPLLRSVLGGALAGGIATGPLGATAGAAGALLGKSGGGGTPEYDALGNATGRSDLSSSAEKAADALDKVAEAGTSAQKTLNDADIKKGLGAIGATDARKQAGIDLAFEPEEQRLKLAKDRLAVENSVTNETRARLAVIESGKRREEAALAPEEADENLTGAKRRRDSALSKFLRNRGVDTSSLDTANAQGQDADDLRAAETAVKRAEIQKKYAYLEPKKAELEGQKAQTDLNSAELEKQDTSLRFAKDSALAPVSHELQQLKYSESLLKKAETGNKIGEQQLSVLQQILGKNERGAQGDNPSSQPEKRASDGSPLRVGDGRSGYKSYRYENGEQIDTTGAPEPTAVPLPAPRPSEAIRADNARTNGVEDVTDKLRESLSKLDESVDGTATKIETEGDKLSVSAPAEGRARGGPIRGPGTGTSDSIHVMASDGEFYHQAAAVNHYGLDFMHSVNDMTYRVPRFSLGGLLSGGVSIPRLARGGPVQSAASGIGDLQHYGTVDLRTNWGEHQMITRETTMQHVASAAVRARVAATSRTEPSWRGG